MINPNEARIGNCILIDGSLEVIKNINIPDGNLFWINYNQGYKDPFLEIDEDGHLPDRYKPIPLTPEWLKLCGFEWYSIIHRWRHKETGYLIIEDVNGFRSGYGDGSTKWAPLLYVHQVQNIHFAVTGVEIVINHPEPV